MKCKKGRTLLALADIACARNASFLLARLRVVDERGCFHLGHGKSRLFLENVVVV